MPVEPPAPSYDSLVADLRVLREKGLIRLRGLRLPALQQAALASGESEQEDHDPPAIEALLRRAAELLGGELGEACGYIFGLIPGTRGWKPKDLRGRAASLYNMQPETFRKEPEQLHIGQLAEQVLQLCHERRLRLERVKLERRHPADSRLAIQWLDRFEAYYRLWTPISRLGDDLLAAITTRREPETEHPPWDLEGTTTGDDWNGQEDQARGYVRGALYSYAWFQLELRRFMVRHGGLWIFSDAEADREATDCVYKISWYTTFNMMDDSWLRRLLSQAQFEEELSFVELLRAMPIGPSVHAEWQEFAASCQCEDDEHPRDECRVHAIVKACQRYCQLIDEEWYKIADWYHPDTKPQRPIDGAVLYDKLLADQARARESK
ncbi:MAG TPA: hypothetical protein VHZ03_11665 [Trebonia sp.]|jgi:hypothetical protein|nr:hypothetical protein [Trebonia sp.]